MAAQLRASESLRFQRDHMTQPQALITTGTQQTVYQTRTVTHTTSLQQRWLQLIVLIVCTHHDILNCAIQTHTRFSCEAVTGRAIDQHLLGLWHMVNTCPYRDAMCNGVRRSFPGKLMSESRSMRNRETSSFPLRQARCNGVSRFLF